MSVADDSFCRCNPARPPPSPLHLLKRGPNCAKCIPFPGKEIPFERASKTNSIKKRKPYNEQSYIFAPDVICILSATDGLFVFRNIAI